MKAAEGELSPEMKLTAEVMKEKTFTHFCYIVLSKRGIKPSHAGCVTNQQHENANC